MIDSETPLPDGYGWCTTWTRKRAHISANLVPKLRGKQGLTLCRAEAHDEELARHWIDVGTSRDASGFSLSNLPPCKICVRAMGSIEAEGAKS